MNAHNHPCSVPTPLRKARLSLGLTTSEAGQYVHVTRKTWETWEACEMIGKAPPFAKVELFFRKIYEIGQNRSLGELVVVVEVDPLTSFDKPIDVVAADNYLGLEGGNIIKSMGIRDGRPYIHRTKFNPEDNQHVLDFCARHSVE